MVITYNCDILPSVMLNVTQMRRKMQTAIYVYVCNMLFCYSATCNLLELLFCSSANLTETMVLMIYFPVSFQVCVCIQTIWCLHHLYVNIRRRGLRVVCNMYHTASHRSCVDLEKPVQRQQEHESVL